MNDTAPQSPHARAVAARQGSPAIGDVAAGSRFERGDVLPHPTPARPSHGGHGGGSLLAIDANGIFEFHLNVTLSNGGAGMAVARKVAVLLQSPERSDGYLLEAVYIERLNEQTQFVNESEVGPISVEGRQSQSRRIRFISSRDRPNDKPLEKAGAYTATVLVWTADDAGPTAATGFPFTLTSPKAAILAEMRAGTRHNTVDVHHQGFDRWGPRVVSDSEVRELLAGS